MQNYLIKEVVSACGVSDDVARALLLRLQWNSERIIDQFFEKPLIQELFNYDGNPAKCQDGVFLCPCCYDEKVVSMQMECGHKFCSDCYSEYLLSQFQ